MRQRRLCYCGRSYDASHALQMVLVNEVVNDAVLEQRLSDLCETDPPVLVEQKDLIHKWLTSDLETAMQYSILALKPCEGSEAQRSRMLQTLGIK